MKPKTTDLQIRGIPVTTRDKLRRKAESKGVSMSKYLIDLIERELPRKMPLDEWIALVRTDPPAKLGVSGAELVRGALEEDDARWDAHFASRKEPKA